MKQYDERVKYILSQLSQNGDVRVSDLSKALDCSEVTIRNDIRRLDKEGRLRRTHGGAVRRSDFLHYEFSPGEYRKSAEEKERIALRAYEYINNRDTIAIDDSTTGAYLARIIRQDARKRMVVVTNSLLTAVELAEASNVELYFIGGHLTGTPPSALDNIAAEAIRRFHISKAFIGVNSIDLNNGIYSLGAPQRDVKRTYMDISNDVFVMADHSKFGDGKLFKIGSLDHIKCIITDNEVPTAVVQLAVELGINLDIV